MKEWLYAMQPSIKGNYFECKYYAKVTFQHAASAFGKKIGEIHVPIQIYYVSNSFT